MGNGKKHILLVDDDSVILTVGQGILSDFYKVTTLSSAEKMMEFLKSNRSDLILLDVMMPDVNGYEAIKKLKDNSETRDIPVIFLTGKTDVEAKLEGYSLGAVDYITKPFDPNSLLSRIKLILL